MEKHRGWNAWQFRKKFMHAEKKKTVNLKSNNTIQSDRKETKKWTKHQWTVGPLQTAKHEYN